MKTPKNIKKISDKFLLIQSIINYPIHYNSYKFSKDPNNTNNYLLMDSYKNIENKKTNSLSKYIKNKNIKKTCLLKKLQRNKLDIFINNAYDKINNKIRDYNYKNNYSNKNLMKLKTISQITKESIKDDLLFKYKNILGNKNPFVKSPLKQKNELIWSQKILAEKKLKDYRRIYSIKYLKIDNNIKFKVKNMKNSFNIINNILEEKYRKNKTYNKIKSKKLYSPFS